MNPPFRNKRRDFIEANTAGRNFGFLSGSSGVRWLNGFPAGHHNLAGYFVALALNLLSTDGMCSSNPLVLSVALRNVLDLHKYPEDAAFHWQILESYKLLGILFLEGDAFPNLPHACRRTRIDALVLKMTNSCPLKSHKVAVKAVSANWCHDCHVQKTTNAMTKLIPQAVLQAEGLGSTDAVLVAKYGLVALRALWLNLSVAHRTRSYKDKEDRHVASL
eukprot:SAG31_NODE_4447_length_3223_cov_2.050576_3_plen_219_part_00